MAADLDRAYVINGDDLRIALDNQWVYAANREGTHHAQIHNAEEVARVILDDIGKPPLALKEAAEAHCHHGCTCPWPPDALHTDDRLPMPPDAPDTPLEDEELLAMQEILDALAPLDAADPAAVRRVLTWAFARYDL